LYPEARVYAPINPGNHTANKRKNTIHVTAASSLGLSVKKAQPRHTEARRGALPRNVRS
jgi:hypothetical protein